MFCQYVKIYLHLKIKTNIMNDVLLRQDNRITMARYELSLIEKRVMYYVLKEIRKQFVLEDNGQRDLFNDLVVTMDSSQLVKEVYPDHSKEVKQALKSLRLRSLNMITESLRTLKVTIGLKSGL